MRGYQQHFQEQVFHNNRVRWSIGSLVPLIGGGLLFLLQSGEFSFTSRPSADFFYIVWSSQAALFTWLFCVSRLEPIQRVKFLAIIFAIEMLLYASLRLDGYAGDGRAILTWRWTLNPEEQFRWSQQKSLNVGQSLKSRSSSMVDLRLRTSTDSPGFRGEDRLGIVRNVRLSKDWEYNPPRLLWRQPVGIGWSSFAIVGEYCVTQEQRGDFETVVCYELKTGHECWTHRDNTKFFEVTGGGGPRATPSIHDGRVYSLGATGILNCLEGATGKVVWSVDILAQHNIENRLFGMAGSPLIVDEKVIVAPGAIGNSLVAYHLVDGKQLWGGGNAESAYSSPQYAFLAGREQILNFNAEGLYAHDLTDGKVIWTVPWVSNPEERNNVCQPVVLPSHSDETPDRVLISSGYGRGSALFEITNNHEGFHVKEVWRSRNLKAKFTSVVVKDGYVYGLDERILTCIDLQTGKRQWKRGRFGHGQLILVDDLLLVQAESGDIVFVEATPDSFRELTRFKALDDRTWNHPALAGNFLLVRNDREAACYALPLAK